MYLQILVGNTFLAMHITNVFTTMVNTQRIGVRINWSGNTFRIAHRISK